MVGYSALTWAVSPFWLGKESEYHQKERLDAQLVYIASSLAFVQAVR